MPPTDATPITGKMLAGFVERNAGQRPNNIAIRYRDRVWTWSEWALRIRRSAGALRSMGVKRGQCVAFLDKNYPACLEVLHSAASIGAATAILNWRLASDEMVHALSDCGAHVLYVGAELNTVARAAAGRVSKIKRIVVVGGNHDQYESLIAAASPAGPDAEIHESEAALVIYSSGTTGRPKGVLLSQRALVNQSCNLSSVLPFAEGDANFVALPLFHVGGIDYALSGIRVGVPTILGRDSGAASLLDAVHAGATHAILCPSGDCPVPRRRGDRVRRDVQFAIHRVRSRTHAPALTAAGAIGLAHPKFSTGVWANRALRRRHGTQ